MTATDELRALLGARGVEWGNVRSDGSESDHLTEWQFDDNKGRAVATDLTAGNGLSVETHRYSLTPAQAVEATLGRGECHMERESGSDRLWYCDACGAYHEHASEYPWEYCPRCGRKVVTP